MLIALTVVDHVHHDQTRAWYRARSDPFATCPTVLHADVAELIRDVATQQSSEG